MKKIFTVLSLLWGFCAFAGIQIQSLDEASFSRLSDSRRVLDNKESLIADKNASKIELLSTRASAAPSCYLVGSIFQEDLSQDQSLEMQLNSDGTFSLTPGQTYPGNLFLIYNSGEEESQNVYLYALDSAWEIGDPIKVATEGNYYIQFARGGEFTFTFDPIAGELTVTGESMPYEYYLSGKFNNDLRGDPNYKFTPLNDGSGNYTLSFKGSLNYFIIDTGTLALYYGSNGNDIQKGVTYKTIKNSGNYIVVADGYDIVDPVLTFNPGTSELYVEGNLEIPEYAYRIMFYNSQSSEELWMEEQPDGIFVFEPGYQINDSQFYIARYNKSTNALYNNITAEYAQYLEIGVPMPCAYNGYYFYVLAGTYKFIFDPEAFTLTIQGEQAKEMFYLYSVTTGDSYPLQEIEGSGVYGVNHIPVLMSEFYVYSSYLNYYQSNGEQLVPGEVYQTTLNSGQYIETRNNENLFVVNVQFVPGTGELLVMADETQPQATIYAIYGTIFNDEEQWVWYPLKNIEGKITLENPIQIYNGDFTIMKYDAGVDFQYYYEFFGPLEDFTSIELGQPMQCYSNQNTFSIGEGEYNFIYSPESKTLLVYSQQTSLPDAYLSVNNNLSQLGCNYIIPYVDFVNVSIPKGDYTFSVYYKKENDSEYSSQEVTLDDKNSFKFTISDLTPSMLYNIQMYVVASNNEKTYTSEVYNYQVGTYNLLLNPYLLENEVTADEYFISIMINGNFINVENFDVYYTYLPLGEPLDEENYTKTTSGNIFETTLTDLAPGNYRFWIKIETDINGVLGSTGNMYIDFTISNTSAVEEISDKSQEHPVYYDLNGHKVANPAKGLFIEVKGNSVRKIYIK